MNSNNNSKPFWEGGQGSTCFPDLKDFRGLLPKKSKDPELPNLLDPVRRIPVKRGSLAGHIPFPALNRSIWFESSLERDLLLSLKAFDGLIGVLEQPVRLCCSELGFAGGIYTPDFLVWPRIPTSPLIRPALIEVKFEDDLKKDWLRLKPKLLAGRRFAKHQEWRFLLMTVRHLRVPRPLPPLLSRDRIRRYDLRAPLSVISRIFGVTLAGVMS